VIPAPAETATAKPNSKNNNFFIKLKFLINNYLELNTTKYRSVQRLPNV
jgi:hypothetical protein